MATIYEDVGQNLSSEKALVVVLSYKEAKVMNDALEEYTKNNKRKKIAKRLYSQFYKELPY